MSVYFDTSAPGSGGPLSASAQVFNFGDEEEFYLAVASNVIISQATGPSVQFIIYSRTIGRQPVQVDYGTTNTTFPVKYTGYMVEAIVPTVGGSVSCRVVLASGPFPLTVQTVTATGAVAITGVVDNNQVQITTASRTYSNLTTGAAGVAIGTVAVAVITRVNTAALKLILYFEDFYFSYSGAVAPGNIYIAILKTSLAGIPAVRPVFAKAFAVVAAGSPTYEWSVPAFGAASPGSDGYSNGIFPLNGNVELLPGETLSVEAYTDATVDGTLIADVDYYAEPA